MSAEKASASREPRPIERLERPSPEAFAAAFRRGVPVVLRGLIEAWPAMRTWSFESLAARCPTAQVRVEVWLTDESNTAEPDRLRNVAPTRMELATFVALLGALPRPSKKYYAVDSTLLDPGAPLHGDVASLQDYMVGLPPSERGARPSRFRAPPTLWMGPAGTISNFHFDGAHNFNVQITGRKEFVLVSPRDSAGMYLGSRDFPSTCGHYSPVDPHAPDLARFPRYADVVPIGCILEPGEVIFIPHLWWHYVRSLEPSISVNFWWSTRTTAPRNFARSFETRLRRAMA